MLAHREALVQVNAIFTYENLMNKISVKLLIMFFIIACL